LSKPPGIDACAIHLETDIAAAARRDARKRGAGAAVTLNSRQDGRKVGDVTTH
jgi:hypothetical protein